MVLIILRVCNNKQIRSSAMTGEGMSKKENSDRILSQGHQTNAVNEPGRQYGYACGEQCQVIGKS